MYFVGKLSFINSHEIYYLICRKGLYSKCKSILFIITRMKKSLIDILRLFGGLASLPFIFRNNQIQKPEFVSHSKWIDFLSENFNKEGLRILEIGSRNVTGANLRDKFSNAEYIGFDFYDGENVDIVGDAHKLSSYFLEGTTFDLIFCSAVFEHLHMPWVVAVEIHKLLKVDGFIFVETHFSFASHERPWNFFQFSEMGLRSLFNDALGFKLIDFGLSNPMVGYFSHKADNYLKFRPIPELYCHSEILCQKVCNIVDFKWESVHIDEIVGNSRYPKPPKKYGRS